MSINENSNPVFFYSAKSDNEAEIILSKLKASGILAFVKRNNLDAVNSCDIYVPYAALSDANNILSINEADLPPFRGEESLKPAFSKGFIKKLVIYGVIIIVLATALYFVSKLA